MPQHLDALARANEVRLVRADVKHKIATGEFTVQQVLADLPPEIGNMTISELLMSQHRWGAYRTRALCRCLQISELRPIGRLTVRERDRVVEMLPFSNPHDIEWAA